MAIRHRKRAKQTHSMAGNAVCIAILIIMGSFMGLPLVLAVCNSLKPLEELFIFPPRFFVRNPTGKNFQDIFVLMNESWVPFSRYIFNTVFITLFGTAGHLFVASLCAYPLAKHKFPGRNLIFWLIVTALLFSGHVTAIPNYLVMAKLNWLDNYLSLIVPAIVKPMGLFLMKQFMEGLPTSLIEAAKIDGATEWCVFSKIVMPNVKPAWLTLIIFSVQALWNNRASTLIYSEEMKTLPYAMQQIQAGGIARTGEAAAVLVVLMVVPIAIFIFSESQILETMASSGLKD